MHKNPGNRKHHPETESHGEFQRFTGRALSPDDGRLERRVRRGRPAAARRNRSGEADAGAKDNKRSE
jgi:hypothetical protein